MNKTIYLARHAKSSWDSGVSKDFGRPLSGRGQRDAIRMGEALNERGWKPQKIISSPALRAQQTCLVYCQSLDIPSDNIVWNRDIYAAYTVTLLHILTSQPESIESLMLVGHNPAMEDLLEHLCLEVPRQKNGKLFTTGNVARLSVSVLWKDLVMHDAKLEGLLRPKEL